MTMLSFLLKAFACWRISYMLVNEPGPFKLVSKLRALTGVTHDESGNPVSYPDNNVFSCIWCMSVWVGLVLAFVDEKYGRAFSISGLALLIHTLQQGPKFPPMFPPGFGDSNG